MSHITLIIPAYNEAASIAGNVERMLAVAGTVEASFTALVVDDGSSDGTAQAVRELAAREPRVRLLSLTRNFGKEAAIAAGLDHADDDAVIVLDADLQHPPELIPRMIELWQQGFPVVEAVKRDRGDAGPGGKWSALLFYALFRRLAGLDLQAHSDFKLLDRAVVERLRALPERRRFFRGLIAWMGYPSATLPFDVPPRAGGAASWSTWRLVRYAVDNLTGFSALPLVLVGWIGAIVLLVGSVTGAVALYQKFAGIALDGFTTVIVLLALASGALMLSLGIVGLYLARIYEELKGRPLYLLREEPRRGEGPTP